MPMLCVTSVAACLPACLVMPILSSQSDPQPLIPRQSTVEKPTVGVYSSPMSPAFYGGMCHAPCSPRTASGLGA